MSLTAIVTDVKYRMSLALIRDLDDSGVSVIACHRDEPDGMPPLGFFSGHTAQRQVLPSDGYEEALYELCRTVAERDGRRPALLPVGTSTLVMLSTPETQARFSSVCGLFIPTSEHLDKLNDKSYVAELAKTHGIPVPRSYAPADGESVDSFLAGVPLPCVVKPRWGEGLGLSAAQRYVIAFTQAELNKSFTHYFDLADEIPLIQEYLPGEAKGCSVLAQNGTIMRMICHRRIREYPVTGGPSTCCETIRDSLLEEYATRMVSASGLNGLAMFEFKDDADGHARLLEVNPRIWGTYPLTRLAKTDFSYTWFVLSFNNGNPDATIPCPQEPEYLMHRMHFFPSDLAAAQGYLNAGKREKARGAFLDLLRPGVKDGLFEWGDMRPALSYWLSLLKRDKQESPISSKSIQRVDLHVHTTISSDGRSTPVELAKAAAARGLDAIVLTDHDKNAQVEPEMIEGVWVLPGCECSTDTGHILGLLPDRPPDIESLCKNGLPSAADAITMFRDCNAVTVLAHPFQRETKYPDMPVTANSSVDCIEISNARAYFKNAKANTQAAELAKTMGLPSIGGSDAHSAGEVGNAYTIIDAEDCSPQALREALLAGCCKPVLVRNTPRRFKGLSQLRKAKLSGRPGRIIIGIAYICYCVLLDILKGSKT